MSRVHCTYPAVTESVEDEQKYALITNTNIHQHTPLTLHLYYYLDDYTARYALLLGLL